MSKLSKRAISILVIATFMLSMMPILPVHAIAVDGLFAKDGTIPKIDGDYGDTVVVIGSGVTSGAIVNLYWDYVNTAGLVNNTEANPDGSFEVWFKVPEAVQGLHYLWVKDMETGETATSAPFEVFPLIKLSPSSGLPLDPVTVTGYGFSESKDFRVYFGVITPTTDIEVADGLLKIFDTAPIVLGTETVTMVEAVTGATVTLSGSDVGPYTGSLYPPVEEKSATITATADWTGVPDTVVMTDPDGDGALESGSASFSAGIIDYATGGISFTLTSAPDPATISATADYTQDLSYTVNYIDGSITFNAAPSPQTFTIDYSYPTYDVTVGTPSTDSLGTLSTTFKVPDALRIPYPVTVYDEAGISDDYDDMFTVGAGISITPDEGPSGVIVSIDGRGFERLPVVSETITVTVGGVPALTEDKSTFITLGDGVTTFSEDWVIPTTPSEGSKELIVTGSVTGQVKTTFDVTGLTAIKLTPGFGPPGGTVEINGYNFTQIAGTEVTLDFGEPGTGGVLDYATYETDSDGEFSDTIRIPAIDYGIHTLKASDDVFGTVETKDFRIGIMIIILSPSYGPTGTLVSLTGIGFTDGGTWNATMDGMAITDEAEDITPGTETISESLFIPTVPVDTYEITVLDIESEIDLYEIFHVTATTEAWAEPASMPNKYTILLKGSYFSQDSGNEPEFILFNSTHDWDITDDVNLYDPDAVAPDPKYTSDPAALDAEGNFTAWWEVPDKDVLSLGCYKINVTDTNGLFAQIDACVCEERIYITPRKVKFDRGDTVQFDIKNDFDYPGSYMKIYDPNDNLYWQTGDFDTWLKVADLYTVPYYSQNSGGNPMTLAPDAPMGEWFWAFYTFEDKQLINGTFEVGKSAAAILSEQLGKLSGDMSALTDQIDDVTDNIDDLSGEIGDVITDVEGMIDDITTDLAEELAGVAADTEAALSEFEDEVTDSIGDIAAAQNELASDLEESLQTSIDAKEAAESAKDSAQGLTTLVYGAIAASLIAALAAVVSLMQISKKIA